MTLARVDTEALNARINLQLLAEQDTTLKRKSATEFAGPCPFCGGTDRFAVKPSENIWLCRHCTDGKWTDAIDYAMRRGNTTFLDVARYYLGNDAPKFDPQVAAQREARRQAEQARRVAELARIMAQYTSEERWAAHHACMAEDQRAWWRMQGIPDDWQNYLELGYTPDKVYRVGDEERHSPAYTIPYFHNTTDGKQFKTLQYRLTDPANPADRYRFEYGLPATFYEVTPTQPLQDTVIICEGAKKAAVTQIYTNCPTTTSVTAVPGKASWGGIVEAVKDCGRVYIVLDPDGQPQAEKLASEIGRQARVVRLHAKIDDALLQGWMDKGDLRQAFKWAERAK
jgi:hypothetical protein